MSPFGLFGPPDVDRLKTKSNVQGLIKALAYKQDTAVRQAAMQALAEIGHVRDAVEALRKIGDAQAIESLIIILKDKDIGSRSAAAEALDELDWQPEKSEAGVLYWTVKGQWKKCAEIGSSAVEPLVAMLKDKNLREVAAQALVNIGSPATEPLIDLLKDEDKDVKRTATEVLGQIGDPRAVGPLSVALRDWQVREVAAGALARIGAPAKDALIEALRDFKVCRRAAEALYEIIGRPSDDDPVTQAWYALAVGDLSWVASLGAPAVEPLIAHLRSADSPDRRLAVQALGRIRDPRAVEPLIEALEHTAGPVRADIARSLEAIGDPRAVEPLIRALNEAEGGPTIARTLAEIGDPRAVEPLIVALKEWDLPRAPAIALGDMGDARAIEPLIAVLKHTDQRVRNDAAEALEKLGWQPDASESGARYWMARGKWDKCVEIGTVAIEPLITALEDRDRGVRKAVATALDKLGWQPDNLQDRARYHIAKEEWDRCITVGAPAVDLLIAVLKNSDVRAHAGEALAKIGTPARDALIGALRDNDADTRHLAAELLVKIGDTQAVGPLISALNDDDWRVRTSASKALAKIGDSRAIVPLIGVVRDNLASSYPSESPNAAKALDDLGWQPDRGKDGAAYWIAKGQWDRCVEIGDPAVEPLLAVLGRSRIEYDVKQAVIETLGKIGDMRAVQSLILQVKYESSVRVRDAAVGALKVITEQDFGRDAVLWEQWWEKQHQPGTKA